MRNRGWWVILIALACGCGKDDAKDKVTGSGTGTGTGTVTKAADCAAACEHRKACGIAGDVAACGKDCGDLTAVLGTDQLAPYLALSCTDVAAYETGFKVSVACQKACAHRAGCLPEGKDQKLCIGDCTGFAMAAGDAAFATLTEYTKATCDVVKTQEVQFQLSGTCVRACKHALECGVEGTFPACFAECAQNLQKGAYTTADLDKVIAADCATVKAQIKITPPQAQAVSGSACAAACANFERCGIQNKDACMAQCGGSTEERLMGYASVTCDQLRAGDSGTQGRQCLATGKDDCPVGQMCCSGGAATNSQRPGMCLYPSLCYAPRY